MGFIDIDDRDTFNYYGNTQDVTLFKDWLQQLKAELPTYRISHIRNGLFKVDLPVITCIGSDVKTHFNIPFMHELHKMELKHTDATLVDSGSTLEYSLQRKTHTNLLLYLHQIKNITASDMYDEYTCSNSERCQYLLITNSANTDKLYITFYILILGD